MSRAYVFDCWSYNPDTESFQVVETDRTEQQARFQAIDQHRAAFGLCPENGPLVRVNLEEILPC